MQVLFTVQPNFLVCWDELLRQGEKPQLLFLFSGIKKMHTRLIPAFSCRKRYTHIPQRPALSSRVIKNLAEQCSEDYSLCFTANQSPRTWNWSKWNGSETLGHGRLTGFNHQRNTNAKANTYDPKCPFLTRTSCRTSCKLENKCPG